MPPGLRLESQGKVLWAQGCASYLGIILPARALVGGRVVWASLEFSRWRSRDMLTSHNAQNTPHPTTATAKDENLAEGDRTIRPQEGGLSRASFPRW